MIECRCVGYTLQQCLTSEPFVTMKS